MAFAVLAAAGWLSLMTWSALDPSLTHATSGLTRNWLGPLGAIASDLLLQTLGFAATLALLAAAFLAGELIVKQRIAGFRLRVWVIPAAVLVLAGAISSLPAPTSWPLNHGLGGMLGDAVFNLAAGALSMINPARGGAVAGLVMFAAGMCLLSAGLGLTQRDWALLWMPMPGRRGFTRSAIAWIVTRGGLDWLEAGSRSRAGWLRRRRGAAAPAESEQQVPAALAEQPTRASPDPGHEAEPASARAFASPVASQQTDLPQHRQPAFDHATDHASQAMAARFAPSARLAEPAKPVSARMAGDMIASLAVWRSTNQAWRRPSLNILKRPPPSRASSEHMQPVLRGSARLLEDVLADFSIAAEVKDIRPGPVVTLFEVEPARGIKSARVIALADDIARSMSAASARIAILPGRNAIGIELPNVRRETVLLRELLESDAWRTTDAELPVVLGKAIGGEPVVVDLARMPHLLMAGTTGSGKSVGINVLILSLLYRRSPAECRLILIDPKMLELSVFNGIPHLLAPVVTDPHQAAGALAWVVVEMEERYKRMAALGVRNVEMFNTRVRNAKKRGELAGRTVLTGYDSTNGEAVYEREQADQEPMPYIVVVVDELADLMVVAGREIESSVQRLAQMARAAGIHLVLATQRPSVDVITGTIKANLPARLAYKVASRIDSRTILGEQGAEHLLGAGDMLFAPGSGQVVRVHGALVTDEEVEGVVAALREAAEPVYAQTLVRASASHPADAGPAAAASATVGTVPASEVDDLFDRAVAIVHRDRKASVQHLLRRLAISHGRAAELMGRLQREGLISAPDADGRHQVLIGLDDLPPGN